MSDALDASHRDRGGLTGRHVLFAFIGFFGIVFAVNLTFLFKALSTYTGVVSNEPYRKGLAYNERIAADERQSQLGWKDELSVARDGALSVVLKDAGQAPVGGLAVSATISRPSTAQFDRPMKLVESAAGTYSAKAGALDEGSWLVTIEARRVGTQAGTEAGTEAGSKDPVYRARKRIWLTP